MIKATLSRLLAPLCLVALLGACDPVGTAPGWPPQDGAQVLAVVQVPNAPRGNAKSTYKWISYAGGDGSSIEKAVLIKGARGDADGVQTEYDWLAKYMPGWQPQAQALLMKNGRAYDALLVQKSDQTTTVYFDITEYLGKGS